MKPLAALSLLALATSGLWSQAAIAGTPPREVEPQEIRKGDLEIVMALDASASDIGSVRREVVKLGAKVERYAFVSGEDALEQLREEATDSTFDDVDPNFLAVSFRLDVRPGVDRGALSQRLELPGVDYVSVAPDPADPDVQREACREVKKLARDARAHRIEVFMVILATEQQIADVQSFVESADGVKQFRFLDKQAALREFRRIFKHDPEILESITSAEALPTSFKVRLADRDAQEEFIAEVEVLPGVDGVSEPKPSAKLEATCAGRASA